MLIFSCIWRFEYHLDTKHDCKHIPRTRGYINMLKIFKQIGLWLIWLYKFIVQLLILFITMILNISFKRTLYCTYIHAWLHLDYIWGKWDIVKTPNDTTNRLENIVNQLLFSCEKNLQSSQEVRGSKNYSLLTC